MTQRLQFFSSRRPVRAAGRLLQAALVAGAVCTSAGAQSLSVELKGSMVERIRSEGTWVERADLRWGESSGSVSLTDRSATTRNADSRNLESYFTRSNVLTPWEVSFGPWTPGAGPAADFFLFEVGGNDVVQVRARFQSGSIGDPVALGPWVETPVFCEAGDNRGQRVHAMSFHFEDLKLPGGGSVTSQHSVTGIQVISNGIDGAAFLIRQPGVHAGADGNGDHSISPLEPRVGSPMELSFLGPWESETGESPNPFLDYRLSARFDGPGGRSLEVPGFFDADGGSGDVGNVWTVRFLPPTKGTWTASVAMRSGAGVAIQSGANAGSAVTTVDGRQITFEVKGIDPAGKGLYRLGTLADSGRHHRKFEHGPFYLKAGINGPENFLANRAMDDITKTQGAGNLHSFAEHRADWNPGDPLLRPGNGDEDGKGAIGALNYLAEKGVNSMFLLVMNLGGDGRDVYPFIGPKNRAFEKRHYDTSRLRQWNTIFEHAQGLGISLSLVMNETEVANELWLDGGTLGTERRLFYREVIARFGHHPALRWNLCEETDFNASTLGSFAQWITDLDAYEHAISLHNRPDDLAVFQSVLTDPNIDAASLQFSLNSAEDQIEELRSLSTQAGRPWIIDADEMNPWPTGLTDSNADDVRKRVLYDALFSGGGVEFYLGWHNLPLGGDLSIEDFRTRDDMWTYVGHARRFMEAELPFWEMHPNDSLLRNEATSIGEGQVYSKDDQVYAVYLPEASATGELNLGSSIGAFEQFWFNPRTGEYAGQPVMINSTGGWLALGSAPSEANEDWVTVLRRHAALSARSSSGSVSSADLQQIYFHPGEAYANRDFIMFSSLSGTSNGFVLGGLDVPINFDRWTRTGLIDTQGAVFRNQLGTLNSSGAAGIQIRLNPAFISGLVGQTMYHCAVTRDPYDFVSNVITLQILP
jgi:hypothetical protein